MKAGDRDYTVQHEQQSGGPARYSQRVPVKVMNGTTVYMRDVVHVRDGYAVQLNSVRQMATLGPC